MSLSSFLDRSPHVRAYLREKFPKPAPVARGPLRVKRSCTYPSRMGTAFDYALRWSFLVRSPFTVDKETWVAESALRLMRPGSRYYSTASAAIQRARSRLNATMKSGVISDDLLRSAMDLAVIDPVFRAHVGHEYIGRRVRSAEIAELRSLLDLVPYGRLRPRRRCLLNPVLAAALEIGGADLDLLVDDMILEVKTTSDGTCKRDYLNQLLGYYLLYLEAGISQLPRRPRIRRLALYFSRQGNLVVWPVAALGSSAVFEAARRWFMKQVRNRPRPSITITIVGVRPNPVVEADASRRRGSSP